MKTGVVKWTAGCRGAAALLVTAIGLGGLGGCANTAAMDDLRDANRSLTERNLVLQRSLQEAQNEVAVLQRERTALDAALGEHKNALAGAQGDLASQKAAWLKFQEDLGKLQLGAIDPETDAALARLAAAHPELIKYDSARGMLRVASDLTFDSGQDAVKEGAKSTLAALAKILTTDSASKYEILIIGHTDSQPVSAATRERGHPTNMHLSCHRAIAVRRVLGEMGLPYDRIYAEGWGEHRPAVPNNQNGNTPANRRVEIYLTRPTSASLGEGEPTPAPPKEAATQRPVDVTK